MDKPKTPETLESESPCEKFPKEASGSSGINQDGSELASVSDIPDELGFENVDVETQKDVEDERLADVSGVEDSARFGVEKGSGNVAEIEKGCLVGDDCVDEMEKKAKLDSVESLPREENNDVELGLLEPQSAGDEDVGVKDKVDDKETGEENPSESNGVASSEGISLYVDISGSPIGFTKREDRHKKQGRSMERRESSFVVGEIVWAQTKHQLWWPAKICDPIDAPKCAAKTVDGACVLVWCYGLSHFSWCLPFQVKSFYESFEEMSSNNKAWIFIGAVEKAVDEFGRRVKSEMTCLCQSKGNQQSEAEASSDGGVINSGRKSERLGGFSATNFEPLQFLEQLKYLAEVVTMPPALDFAITQNRLSAFYSSIGRRHLPIHLLAERDDSGEETLTSPTKNGDHVQGKKAVRASSRKSATKEGFVSGGSRERKTKKASELEVEDNHNEAKNRFRVNDEIMEKGFSSRERKKSRYLSYPYINLGQKGPAEEEDGKGPKVSAEASVIVSEDITSPGNSKSNGEKFWKKWYKRFSGGIHVPDDSELRNAAPAELLHALLSAAVDGLHPNQNNGFSSVGWFFSRFRISAYHDESVDEICPKNMAIQNEASETEACLSGNNAREKKPKEKRKKKTENPTEDLQVEASISSPNVVENNVPAGGEDSNRRIDPSLEVNWLTAVKKTRRSGSGRLKAKPLSGLSDVPISVGVGVPVKEAPEMEPPMPCNKAKQRKKKKGQGTSVEQTTVIPDLNGSSAMQSLNDPQIINHVASESTMNPDANPVNVASGLLDPNGPNAKTGNLVVDLRAPQEGLPGLNYISHTAALMDIIGNNVKPGLIENGLPFGVPAAEQGKPVPKKRKRKEKVAAAAAAEHIPDLNGATGEPNSAGKETQETNGVTPPAQPKRKKKKKTEVLLNYPRNPSLSKRPAMNSGYSGAETEALGAALVLTFSPGAAMPSREDLVLTFGKFGQLKEPETRVSKDTSSAQIGFVKSADASEALKSIERNNPFGSTLVNFRLHQFPAPPKAPEASHAQASTQPPLDFIKQNLQMMTSMLEKSGDSLSLEMRTKLEAEIKALFGKVSSMAGSCSQIKKS